MTLEKLRQILESKSILLKNCQFESCYYTNQYWRKLFMDHEGRFWWDGLENKWHLEGILMKTDQCPFPEYSDLTIGQAIKADPEFIAKKMFFSRYLFSPNSWKAVFVPNDLDHLLIFNFGQHRGQSLKWILENDLGYLEWIYQHHKILHSTFYHVLDDRMGKLMQQKK